MPLFRFKKVFSLSIRYLFIGLSLLGVILCVASLFGMNFGISGWWILLLMFARIVPHTLAIIFMFLTTIFYMIGVECLPEFNGEMSRLHKSFHNCLGALFSFKSHKK